MMRRSLLIGLVVLNSCSFDGVTPSAAECYELELDHVSVVSMLQPDFEGDTLILSTHDLDGSPGATEGYRAFLGAEAWRDPGPIVPSSWHWRPLGGDSIRVGFVLPLAGIVWDAERIEMGIQGVVRYTSDEAGEPVRSTRFFGRKVTCPDHPEAEHGA